MKFLLTKNITKNNKQHKKEEELKKLQRKSLKRKQVYNQKETEIYLANLIMKSIDEAVFLPVDIEEAQNLKHMYHFIIQQII